MVPLHIGADHLGYLPLLLAAGVIVFIAATALRTKLERMSDDQRKQETEREARHGERGGDDGAPLDG